jgi:hypothetical protein
MCGTLKLCRHRRNCPLVLHQGCLFAQREQGLKSVPHVLDQVHIVEGHACVNARQSSLIVSKPVVGVAEITAAEAAAPHGCPLLSNTAVVWTLVQSR